MPASNTRDCFREFIGQRIIGVLFDALPTSDKGLAVGTKTLVFEDGRGLTIASNGSYWIDNAGQVRAATERVHRALVATSNDLRDVLALAGSLTKEGTP